VGESRLLYGREEMPARWKFCIAYVNGNLGMAVGSLFVTKYFDVQSKQDVSDGRVTRPRVRRSVFFKLGMNNCGQLLQTVINACCISVLWALLKRLFCSPPRAPTPPPPHANED
jgi:hypothetical protein